jgi:hypothetical protein
MNRMAARAAILVIAAAAFGASALAQQSGGAKAPAGGGAQGTVGGGATGASNRGGAGGVSNPAPGGGSPDAGGGQNSLGPNGTTNQRSGYLGGRTTEPSDGGTGTITSVTTVLPGPGGRFEADCRDANPGALSPVDRVSGRNADRLSMAEQHMGQVANAARAPSHRLLLASVQEELSKQAPDLELAATYLGIAAGEPVTAETVRRVTELLCVPQSQDRSLAIATIAEGQRLRAARPAR